jgi:hypothetical protein
MIPMQAIKQGRIPLPPFENALNIFLYFHHVNFEKKNQFLHVKIRQLPGASPPGPPPAGPPAGPPGSPLEPLGASRQTLDPLPSTAPPPPLLRNSWIRHWLVNTI